MLPNISELISSKAGLEPVFFTHCQVEIATRRVTRNCFLDRNRFTKNPSVLNVMMKISNRKRKDWMVGETNP